MGKIIINKIEYPLSIANNYIIVADLQFTDGLKDILTESGREPHIKAKLKQRFDYLIENGAKAILHTEWFEHIDNKIHAIRIKDRDLNLRILFTFIEVKDKPHALLLTSFLEKSKATQKRQSYKQYVDKAFGLLEEAKKELSI